MENVNVEKIANLLKIAIKDNDMSHRINNLGYQSIYFSVFFGEIKKNGSPPHGDTFTGELARLLNGIDTKQANQEIENFSKVWNAWVALYTEMNKKELIK